MTNDYGKLLDKQDDERSDSVDDDTLYGASLEKLRATFFSDTVAQMQNNGSTLLTGVQSITPNNIAPFLYFYNSLTMEICPHCPQARDPSLIKPFLERKLLTVVLNGNFSDTPLEFQKVAYEYPEFFVGRKSQYRFKYFSLNQDPTNPHQDHEHFCLQCLGEEIKPHEVLLESLNPEIKHQMKRILATIFSTPTPTAHQLLHLFVNILKNPDPNSIRELSTSAYLVQYLSASKALNAVPQIDTIFFESSDLFLEPLRISHNQNIDLGQYLDVIKDFRGTLSPNLIPSDKEKILPFVTKINDEINKIESSNRLPLGIFLSRFVTSIPSLLTRIVTNGTYAGEGVYDSAPKGFKAQRLSEIKTEILSKYFGVSEAGIQIWQIRNKLDKIKRE